MKTYSVRSEIKSDAREKLRAYSDLVAKLLFYRGVTDEKTAQDFFEPDYEKGMHNPFLLKNMDKAVERIISAIKVKEKIAIFSDYDADGIPGATILHDFFKKIGFENFVNYIPHRHDEGFGLNLSAVQEFIDGNVNLVVTIDCGIADVKEVAELQKNNIDVIVTDHHLPAQAGELGQKLPPAFAIIDAKQEGDNYPYKMLCGAATVYKLICAILQKERFGLKEGQEKWFLDMAGLATLADMVPLDGENRVFAVYGLKVLRKSPRAGLVALLAKLGVKQKELNEDDIGFSIVPRINAASRMGESQDAFELLSTTDPVRARVLAEHLDHINDERKGTVAAMVKEVKKIIAERETKEEMKKVIVIGNPSWRPSLLGLVANSLVEEHARPVFLWGRDGEDNIKGSCRSDGVVSVVSMMEYAAGAFKDFGGHKMSGGFSVAYEHVHTLEQSLVDAYEKVSTGECVEEEFVDSLLSLDDVNAKTYSQLEKISPFGVGNPKPLFMFCGVTPKVVKQFGKEKNHLEISFENSNRKPIKAIGFFMKREDFGEKIVQGTSLNLVATMEKSTFRGFVEYRLRIVDIL